MMEIWHKVYALTSLTGQGFAKTRSESPLEDIYTLHEAELGAFKYMTTPDGAKLDIEESHIFLDAALAALEQLNGTN